MTAEPLFDVMIGTRRRFATGKSASASSVLVPRIAVTWFFWTSFVALVTATCALTRLSSRISSMFRPKTGPCIFTAVWMPVVISSPMGLSFPLRNDSTPILMGSFFAAKAGEPKAATSAKDATINITARLETLNHRYRVKIDLAAIA